MNQSKHDIFISFSFKDQLITEYVGNTLMNEYHISYWMCTRELIGGDHYKECIVDAIKNASLVLMIQSENSLASREVPKEIALALDNNKPVIPFVLDDAELSGDLEYDLIGIQRVDGRKPTLNERIKELANQIYCILGKNVANGDAWSERIGHTRLLSTATVIPKKVFLGRDDTIEEIYNCFKGGERLLFLYGIGGIGKTQIAKQYVKKYGAEYDTVVFATYNGSIRDTVVSNTLFSLEPEMPRFKMSDGTTESDEAFFERKLEKIKKIADERTLIIIDNFDVMDDKDLKNLVDGKYHLLITTRCDYSKFYPTVKINPISSMESLIEIFMQNYDGYDVFEDDPKLCELIELVNRHTYTIELLAQHMENSGQTPSEMIEVLKKEGISSLTEEIRNADMQKNSAYENLLKMFKLFTLSEEEKNILLYLSFMPIDGINVRHFRDWAQLESCKIIKELENKSWLIKNTEGIALHPVICDVIKHEIPVTIQNCGEFLKRFTIAIEDKKMWGAKKDDKFRYAQIGKSLTEAFPEINKNTEEFYYFYQCLLSFSVDSVSATDLAQRLYEYNLKTYGEQTFKTARAAFKCGWVHSVNVYSEYHINQAIIWLEKANKIFKQVQMNTTDEISRHTMTKTNLSKMYLSAYRHNKDKNLYELSKQYVTDAIEHAQANFYLGDYHYSKIAGALMQFAETLLVGEEFTEALKEIEKSIVILIELHGSENNSDMGLAYYLKAYAYYGMKDYIKSMDFAQKSIDKYLEYFGNSHPRIHDLYSIMGDCCSALENHQAAQENYSKSLQFAQLIFAPDSKQIATIKSKLV
ncbi:MAG: toll/interleukin-1 receptor domain-containing protein [Ruminococcaceae bacterium]|nr:toll/interleukin-1 receptor domain-containing protein [Oscillospiraceae bacterium]